MRLALWVLLYSDYCEQVINYLHIETLTILNQQSHLLEKMLGRLYCVGISWRRVIWKPVDKCKINTVVGLWGEQWQDKSQKCLQQFLCSKRAEGVGLPFIISGAGSKRDGLGFGIYNSHWAKLPVFFCTKYFPAVQHGPSQPGHLPCTLELVLCTEELWGGEMAMLIKTLLSYEEWGHQHGR